MAAMNASCSVIASPLWPNAQDQLPGRLQEIQTTASRNANPVNCIRSPARIVLHAPSSVLGRLLAQLAAQVEEAGHPPLARQPVDRVQEPLQSGERLRAFQPDQLRRTLLPCVVPAAG